MPTLLVVGGTWETNPWGQCTKIVTNLDTRWKPIWVPYPAKYAGTKTYVESYTQGKRNLRDQINRMREPYCILGYSQGAKIAGDVAASLAYDSNLLRVYLIADPERHIDDMLIGPAVPGEGVAGPRRVGPKCRQFAQPGDIVCSNENPVFKNMAGSTAMFCIQHPFAWMRIAAQNKVPGLLNKHTVEQIKKFLSSQVHVSYNEYEVADGVTVPDWIVQDMTDLGAEYGRLRTTGQNQR